MGTSWLILPCTDCNTSRSVASARGLTSTQAADTSSVPQVSTSELNLDTKSPTRTMLDRPAAASEVGVCDLLPWDSQRQLLADAPEPPAKNANKPKGKKYFPRLPHFSAAR